jgi:hypothetical protein
MAKTANHATVNAKRVRETPWRVPLWKAVRAGRMIMAVSSLGVRVGPDPKRSGHVTTGGGTGGRSGSGT